ncbi:Hydrolase, alpha/beta fold family protein [Enhygromyxa salina]|uniref:Hydrolase, alpha/beta fold family protein n=2 Tax=Enhygromyxa salina TaxID=215803 RepID=A0A0C2DC42_9BACT|nr:Hydrolase, alpha/beta fold family protein [Enhygromyxa salina]
MCASACERRHTDPPPPTPAPALQQTSPATVAQLCEQPLRAWAVLGEGGTILAHTRGVCLGRIEHPDDGALWHFVAQLQELQGHASEQPSWELHTWLDAAGQPRHAELRTPELVTRFSWIEGALVVRRLGDQLVINDAAQVWVTPGHGIYLRELMLRLGVGGDSHGLHQRGFVPERDAITQLDLSFERLDDDRAHAVASTSVLALEGVQAGLAGLRIAAVFAGDAPIYRSIPNDTIAPFLPASPRPSYRAPAGVELIPIEIPGVQGKPTLAGELVVASEAGAGARPAVLFVGGAGPQDRRGIVPHSPVDIGSHELQDLLAAAGFAVLRVDDRGVGQSGIGDDPNPGFAALIDDARRALAALAGLPQVDPSRIIIIGHGEGALVASILAAEGTRARGRKRAVAGLVLLAAPARNLRELVYDEIRASLAGHRDGEVRVAVGRAQRVHDAALAGEDLPASSEGARAWMTEAFAEDPLARLAKVRAPVLALQGGKDFQVSPERDFALIREWVEQRGAKGSAAELFDELDHLFKREPGVSTPGHYADLRRRVDGAMIERVVSWSLARVGGS